MSTFAADRVSIFGVGACTAVGLSAPSTAAAVRAGIAAMAAHPFMIDKMGAPMIVCASPLAPLHIRGADRFAALASAAYGEALAPLCARHATAELTLLLALPEQRPGMPDRLQRRLGDVFASGMPGHLRIRDVVIHPAGHAGGLLCLEQALMIIRREPERLCLLGGVDSYLDPDSLEWLDATDQLHSETTIWGSCPGEGAAFCILASPDRGGHLGLQACVDVAAVASDLERATHGSAAVCTGQGLSSAFRKALDSLEPDVQIDQTICDMTGEAYRADEFGFAVLRTAKRFTPEADFITPADCWGNVGAASAPLFMILAAAAAQRRYAAGPHTLLFASSDAGQRGAAVLRAPPRAQ